VAAGWVLGNEKVIVPWEFSCERGGLLYRSTVPPLVTCGIPFLVLRNTLLKNASLWVLVLPRMFLFLGTLAADRMVSEMFGDRVFYVFRTSWIAILLHTRPLSNSLESLAFIFCVYFARTQRNFVLGFFIGVGCFVHVTFPVFVFATAFDWLLQVYRNAAEEFRKKNDEGRISIGFFLRRLFSAGILVVIGFLVSVGLHLAVDHQYVVSNPSCQNNQFPSIVNNIKYNMDKENLAEHGLHSHYTHLIANMQHSFSPLWVLGVFLFALKRNSRHWRRKSWATATIGSVLILLSLAPHQEARFLIPLVLPVSVICAEIVTSSWWLVFLWSLFNAIVGVFYGFFHQAGLISALLALENTLLDNSNVNCIAGYETYMAPRFCLTNKNVTFLDLGGMNPSLVQAHLSQEQQSCTSWFLLLPEAAVVDFPNLNATTEIASFFPHFSGERPPSSFRALKLVIHQVSMQDWKTTTH